MRRLLRIETQPASPMRSIERLAAVRERITTVSQSARPVLSRQGAANDLQPHLSEQAPPRWGQPGRAAAVGRLPLPRLSSAEGKTSLRVQGGGRPFLLVRALLGSNFLKI